MIEDKKESITYKSVHVILSAFSDSRFVPEKHVTIFEYLVLRALTF